MKIDIRAPLQDLMEFHEDGGNVQGDELVALMWGQNLVNDPRVSECAVNALEDYKPDISISFNPFLAGTGKHKILYMQNVYPKWMGHAGTVEIFKENKDNFDSYIFPSEGLRDECGGEGLVLQFATDLKYFSPRHYSQDFAHNLCFVGNNIRHPEVSEQYLLCVADKGLVIYGNKDSWQNDYCKEKISMENEAVLYSSAKICLNTHVTEHLDYGSFNFRIFNILACGGFIISDWSEELEKEFKDCMVFTTGYDDLRDKVDYYLEHPEETKPYRQAGMKLIEEKHLFNHRMEALLDWVEDKI